MSSNIDWANAESSDEEDDTPITPAAAVTTSAAPPSQSGDVRKVKSDIAPQQNHLPRNQQFTAMVSNLSFKSTIDTVGNFFADGGCKVADVRIPLNEEGKPRGTAYVDFEDQESLDLALTANNQDIDGRAIRVALAPVSSARRKEGPGRGSGSGRGPREHRGEGRGEGRGDGRGHARERDYGNRYKDPAGDAGGAWVRTTEPLPAAPPRERREKTDGRGGDVRDREQSKGGDRPRNAAHPVDGAGGAGAATNKERPKLTVLPRTMPIEFRAPVATSDIFGGAKPRDATAFEKKEAPKTVDDAITPAATAAAPATGSDAVDTAPSAKVVEKSKPREGRVQKGGDRTTQSSDQKPDGRRDKSGGGREGRVRDSAGKGSNSAGRGRGSGQKEGEKSSDKAADRVVNPSTVPPPPPPVVEAPKKKTANMFSYLVEDDDDSN